MMDKERKDKWLKWGLDHVITIIKENWKTALAIGVVAGTISAGVNYAVTEVVPPTVTCEGIDEILEELNRCLDVKEDR